MSRIKFKAPKVREIARLAIGIVIVSILFGLMVYADFYLRHWEITFLSGLFN